MLFMIPIGVLIFAEFVNITTMSKDLKVWVTRFNVRRTMSAERRRGVDPALPPRDQWQN